MHRNKSIRKHQRFIRFEALHYLIYYKKYFILPEIIPPDRLDAVSEFLIFEFIGLTGLLRSVTFVTTPFVPL